MRKLSEEHYKKVVEGLRRTQKIRSENSSKTWSKKKSEEQRFNEKYTTGELEDDCHVWIAGKNKQGYGYFQPSKVAGKFPRAISAHRYAFQRANPGVIAEEIMHSCDNPSCVNPNHLIGGTHKQNMEDYSKKYQLGLVPQRSEESRKRMSDSAKNSVKAQEARVRNGIARKNRLHL